MLERLCLTIPQMRGESIFNNLPHPAFPFTLPNRAFHLCSMFTTHNPTSLFTHLYASTGCTARCWRRSRSLVFLPPDARASGPPSTCSVAHLRALGRHGSFATRLSRGARLLLWLAHAECENGLHMRSVRATCAARSRVNSFVLMAVLPSYTSK